jgi:hypothetical protein
MKHVVEFVYEEDRSGRLLVVYYAGHGRAGSNGQLLLAGSIAPESEAAGENASIDWTDVEIMLRKTKADVLVIFDCCCAGLLLCRPPELGGRRARRKFLYVAACRAKQRTPSAGLQSFTSVMIWALGELAAGGSGFTVRRLVRTLMSYEHFPRGQEAVVFESRFGTVEGDIWLAPSMGKDVAGSSQMEMDSAHGTPTVDVLNLRFHFAESLTEAVVEDTALAVKEFLRTERGLRCHRVSFLRHKSYVEGPARHWLDIIRKKRT